MSILSEALADAASVKQLALENAKLAIQETFQPQLQRMISSKLAEEDENEEELDVPDLEQEPAPVAAPAAPAPAPVPVADPAAVVDPVVDPEAEEDDLEMSEEYKALVREMEMMDNEEDPELDSNEVVEAILPDSAILEFEDEVDKTPTSYASLKTEVKRLRAENEEAHRALATLKTAVNEVNLLNSKLMYAAKATSGFDLTESQKVKLLKTFDQAKTIREVKLVYLALSESYNKKRARSAAAPDKMVAESVKSASRAIPSIKPVSAQPEFPQRARWQELANIKNNTTK